MALFTPQSFLLRIGIALILSGCALGPDFHRPEVPAMALPTPTDSKTSLVHTAQDIPFDWWTVFKLPILSQLVEQAFKANPNIEAAKAALRSGQQSVIAQQGYFYPSVGLEYIPSRNKLAGNLGGNSPGVQGNGTIIQTYSNPAGPPPYNGPVYYNFHTAQVNVSYTPDVFGMNQRQVESLQAQADLLQDQLEATYITLATNVVASALQIASLESQLESDQSILKDNQDILIILQQQLKVGQVSQLEVSAQEMIVQQNNQAIISLNQTIQQTKHLLAVLMGHVPTAPLPPIPPLEKWSTPNSVPVTIPSEWVKQRPDILAAQEQLHSANALVGVAISNRFPQFTLYGNIGGAASVPSQMFQSGGGFFTLLGDLTTPVFAGGTLKAREKAAQENLKQAAALYQNAVLTGFENVTDTLSAIEQDTLMQTSSQINLKNASEQFELTQQKYSVGEISYDVLLSTDQVYLQAQINALQTKTSLLGDIAALYQALGGGWWNRPNESSSPIPGS